MVQPEPAGQPTSPFVLPVTQPPDRETLAGWQQYRRTRTSFQPAPRLTLADYRRFSPRRKALHDLHRTATHVNLPLLETPMSAAVDRLMRFRMQNNALKTKASTQSGLMVSGGGFQGKTETVCDCAAAFEDFLRDLHQELNPDAVVGTRDLHAPVAYVQTPVTAKPKSVCEAILDFFGAPIARGATLPQLCRLVRASLRDHGTRVLILDDVTRLKMHREADQDALDLMRGLMSMNVTLVLVGVGIRQSGLLTGGHYDAASGQWRFLPRKDGKSYFNDEAGTQTDRRFDLIDLDPFRYDTPAGIAAWTSHLAGLEDCLRLFRAEPGMLTTGNMPEYLFRRTQGVVGLLERLIEDGCAAAIDNGTEKLTVSLLDGIHIDLRDVPGRDLQAGEIPEVPQPPRPSPASKRGRNTVFDDRGPASSSSAS
ncbi:ATP-binding protein [Nonomuraea sp. NPDC003707]